MQSLKRRRYQKDQTSTDDIITLIHLVRQNPALYNYKLQPNQRRRIDVLNGWAHIAAQIGNKYTVEECRRKWKNLRDTYHQYRLRKSKLGDGLSKWRYAKDMDFLSNVYQPKLKSHRTQNYNASVQDNLLHGVNGNKYENEHVVSQDMVHSGITLVNDAETFILTAYEDVTHDNDVVHEDPSIVPHTELTHDGDSIEDCVEIVKNEQHTSSLDDDGATGAEVDYEEVCLYEEAANAPSVDCETIIGAGAGGSSAASDDTKFQYIDTNDFCIGTINSSRSQYSNGTSNVLGVSSNNSMKLKNVSIVTSSAASATPSSMDNGSHCVTIASSTMQLPLAELKPLTSTTSIAIGAKVEPNSANTSTPNTACCIQTREECDLFFDFLKKKIQRFPKEEITAIQVEFLNCVLRREAENAQKSQSVSQTQ